MTWLEAANLFFIVIGGITMPVLVHLAGKRDRERLALMNEIRGRMDHLDSCLDAIRRQVLGASATRADLEKIVTDFKTEIQQGIAAGAADRADLRSRIFRLEGRGLGP